MNYIALKKRTAREMRPQEGHTELASVVDKTQKQQQRTEPTVASVADIGKAQREETQQRQAERDAKHEEKRRMQTLKVNEKQQRAKKADMRQCVIQCVLAH